MTKLNVLKLRSANMYEFLRLEEALLRSTAHSDNWITLIHGSEQPSVIMGSGTRQASKLVHTEHVKRDQIQVIRRYTGGGTVFVDKHTVFVSFVGNTSLLAAPFCNFQRNAPAKAYPKDVMLWTEQFYKTVFGLYKQELAEQFSLRENDYVLGEKKFGGNAQYFTGGRTQRWVHHTSFLWDYEEENMEKYLTLPEKRPDYRQSRQHNEFLTKLKPFYSKQEIAEQEENMFLRAVEQGILQLCETHWSNHVSHLHFASLEEAQAIGNAYFAQTDKQIVMGTEIVHHDKM